MNRKPLLITLAAIVIVIAALVKIGAFESLIATNSLQLTQERAEAGDAKAQLELGKRYFHGNGVDQDRYEALNWALKSAQQSYAPAMRLVGTMYREGQGSAKQPRAAVRWLEKAYEASDDMAAFHLGEMYELGDGVAQDVTLGFSWYKKGTDRKEAWAQYGMANLYRYGTGGFQVDMKQSAQWYLLSAEQGHMYAQNALGWLYKRGLGVDKDVQKAAMWYGRSAEQGYPMAKNNLAWLLSTAKDEDIRNGNAALKIVEGINRHALSAEERAAVLDTFAASYAEVGRFVDAVIAQEKVIGIYQKIEATKQAIAGCEERLAQYRQNKPWRE
ncbi:tetratricopeptide repeat protein [Mariprofundus micogutta]|nr:tetratricopeptide repeat protein [Mariprofundus micogutta]